MLNQICPNRSFFLFLQQKAESMKIIARNTEISLLERKYLSNRAEFVIVYGRRRIGKTYLVNNVFSDRFTFSYVGARKQRAQKQLERFAQQLKEYSGSMYAPVLNSWEEAFRELRQLIENRPKDERKVIFFDEMPWIDTPRSSFVEALEYFWNAWAAQRGDILFIACGSATSWMVNKLIKNTGGLHNRITEQIYLRPFNLNECEEFLQENGCQWDRYTILQCYMAMGGVPYYLSLLDPGMSLAQNIDRLFFSKNAQMQGEFDELFNALFSHAEKYISVMKALAGKRKGLLRDEVISATKLSGGLLTKILENLKRCDFVETYNRYNSSTKYTLYRISDPYTLFFFKFLAGKDTKDGHWWTNNMLSPSVQAWQGFSFETICMAHLDQIKKKLGISGIATECSSWRKQGDDSARGTQIDLLIDRADRIITLCEMKFSREPYAITKDYEMTLRTRMGIFKAETKTKKTLSVVMVTTYGVLPGKHAAVIQNEVTMDDLFEK